MNVKVGNTKNDIIICLHSLKIGCSSGTNKMFLPLQRKVMMLQLIVILTTIFILILLLTNYLKNSISEYKEIGTKSTKSTLHTSTIYKNDEVTFSNPYRILSSKEMDDIRIILNNRRRNLENLCTTINEKDSNLNTTLSNMIIDLKHGISWCPIYKAASSAWMKHFAALAGMLSDVTMDLISRNFLQINGIVKKAFPIDPDFNKVLQKLNETKKFLIIRHPLQRLLSAYRDKLEHRNGREYYYKRFGRHIVHRYRRSNDLNETKLEPTFQEFLQFIAKEKYFDEHWAPYFDTCKPCDIHYDYILKFETFEKDHNFFIQETGLREYLYYKTDLKNTNPHGPTTDTVLKEYLQDIPKSLLQEIYNIYEKDFKLFSYSLFD